MSATNATSTLIPVFNTVADFRLWRNKAFEDNKSVGFIPTMGALHDGHLSLVKHSLAENDFTVISIFVNPAQFAPHEDLAAYPRTLPNDLSLLSTVKYQPIDATSPRTPSAVFVPSVKDMYPSGISQDVADQKGSFVEVKGYGDRMEGHSRPNFFRGVATAVVKLCNIIQPTNAYFGQKDIQQALLMRHLVSDLFFTHPTPSRLHIVPTARDPIDGLALSSRNVYLNAAERQRAPVFYAALQEAARAWATGATKREVIQRTIKQLEEARDEGAKHGVEIRVDYIEINDSETFEEVGDEQVQRPDGAPVLLSGAVWFGRTRLIDNLILGNTDGIMAKPI